MGALGRIGDERLIRPAGDPLRDDIRLRDCSRRQRRRRTFALRDSQFDPIGPDPASDQGPHPEPDGVGVLHEAVLEGVRRRGGAGVDVQLGEDVREVASDRLLAQHQLRRDLDARSCVTRPAADPSARQPGWVVSRPQQAPGLLDGRRRAQVAEGDPSGLRLSPSRLLVADRNQGASSQEADPRTFVGPLACAQSSRA